MKPLMTAYELLCIYGVKHCLCRVMKFIHKWHSTYETMEVLRKTVIWNVQWQIQMQSILIFIKQYRKTSISMAKAS